MRLDYAFEIARPPSEIFAFVSNLENDAVWQSAIVKVVKLSSGRARLGSKYLHVIMESRQI